MLIMVIAKPKQFTIVNAVPLISASALLATIVENKGESAITNIPHKSKKSILIVNGKYVNTIGQSKQHRADNDKL